MFDVAGLSRAALARGVCAVSLAAACSTREQREHAPAASSVPVRVATASAAVSTHAPSPYVAAGSGTPSASAAPSAAAAAPAVMHSYDAGINECRLVQGPLQQPFVGEVALAPTDKGVLVVTHRDGVATVTRVIATTTDGAAPAVLAPGARLPRVASPPCAVAGGFSFCMDPAGAIHRRPLETEGRDTVVARGRPGASFAAELINPVHTVLAYIADRRTTEGVIGEAYAVIDDGPPVRLSDEGSGTTSIELARRGAGLVALLTDGRVAMTPVHARTLAIAGGRLVAGEDAVVFVGGGAETHTSGALGVSATGAAFGLVPISGETGFGVATIRLDDPPRVDEPVTWSLYLNGLDPAPIAATRGVTPIRVARVRPLEAVADAPRGLELGTLGEDGRFFSHGLVSSKGRLKSATIAVDHAGMLWLAFTDGSGTWLERRACP